MAMDLLCAHSIPSDLRFPRIANGRRLDLNLPLTGIAFLLVLSFLRVRTPPGTVKSKLKRLDILYVSEKYA